MRHVITRDASPYPASTLEISGFRCSLIRERRSLAPLRRRLSNSVRPLLSLSKSVRPLLSIEQLIRNSHPQARCLTGIQRISPPRTVGMIAKRRFCVNCRDRPKTQIPHRVCKHGAESRIAHHSKANLFPRFWTVDDIAVRADGNLVRQLALRW